MNTFTALNNPILVMLQTSTKIYSTFIYALFPRGSTGRKSILSLIQIETTTLNTFQEHPHLLSLAP